jgi:5-methylcytosine-specific restriction endonuclease McrA
MKKTSSSCPEIFSFNEARVMSTKRSTLNRLTAYEWYRGSPSWHERREWIFKRANYVCEKCRKRPATEVHHLTYMRVFNEDPADLMALCHQCHAEIHWRQPANDNQIQFSFDFPDEPEEEEEEES